MSSSVMSLAMIPAKEIKPIVQMNQPGMISYKNRHQTRDGIVFRGYLRNNEETTSYGRSGKPGKNRLSAGEVVDLYV